VLIVFMETVAAGEMILGDITSSLAPRCRLKEEESIPLLSLESRHLER